MEREGVTLANVDDELHRRAKDEDGIWLIAGQLRSVVYDKGDLILTLRPAADTLKKYDFLGKPVWVRVERKEAEEWLKTKTDRNR
jgi:hypothetical protein